MTPSFVPGTSLEGSGKLIESLKLARRQLQVESAAILSRLFRPAGAGDDHNVCIELKKPRQGNLPAGGSMCSGDPA